MNNKCNKNTSPRKVSPKTFAADITSRPENSLSAFPNNIINPKG